MKTILKKWARTKRSWDRSGNRETRRRMGRYVGAIDQGTTSTRFVIIDVDEGALKGMGQLEHKQIMPKQGWVEHDPLEIWENTKKTMEMALEDAGVKASDIKAVGITNQRETTVAWDKTTGKPLCNAIVWMDTRSYKICKSLYGKEESGKDRLRPSTGLPIVPYFSGTKMKWILENIDGAAQAVDEGRVVFGTVDSWLMWNLSGGVKGGRHLTDVTNASRTLLLNINTLEWDSDLCNEFGVPMKALPEIVPSSKQLFEIKDCALAGVPLAGILGDQQAALFGQRCFHAGDAKNTYGTGCFLLLNTGNAIVQSSHGLLTTVAYKIGDEETVYALEGSIAIGGAVVQWLRDNLNIIQSAPEVEDLALSVENNGGVYLVPAFSGLFAPYWQDSARGVIVGLTRFANKGHIARAALEATALQSYDVFKAMELDASEKGVTVKRLNVDGGMTANETFLQIQADILNADVTRPGITETTSLGAAFAAGLAIGIWTSVKDLEENWNAHGSKTWQPSMSEYMRKKILRNWKKAIDRTLDWADEDEHEESEDDNGQAYHE